MSRIYKKNDVIRVIRDNPCSAPLWRGAICVVTEAWNRTGTVILRELERPHRWFVRTADIEFVGEYNEDNENIDRIVECPACGGLFDYTKV